MTETKIKTKYQIKTTTEFKKRLKRMSKRGKDLSKLVLVVNKLAQEEILEDRYKNHRLINDKYYTDCYECHIEPDWLLIYRLHKDELYLVLIETGTHSDLFWKVMKNSLF